MVRDMVSSVRVRQSEGRAKKVGKTAHPVMAPHESLW